MDNFLLLRLTIINQTQFFINTQILIYLYILLKILRHAIYFIKKSFFFQKGFVKIIFILDDYEWNLVLAQKRKKKRKEKVGPKFN